LQAQGLVISAGEISNILTRLLQPHNPSGGRQKASDPVECLQGETSE